MSSKTVNLEKDLIKQAILSAKKANRSVSEQIEYWVKIGRIMEDNPDLTFGFAKQVLISREEQAKGLLEEYVFL